MQQMPERKLLDRVSDVARGINTLERTYLVKTLYIPSHFVLRATIGVEINRLAASLTSLESSRY